MDTPDPEIPENGRLAENIVYFARALRRAGLPVGPASVVDAIRAVEMAGLTTRDDFYWTLHAIFVKRREHHAVFEEAFRLFWRSRHFVEKMLAAKKTIHVEYYIWRSDRTGTRLRDLLIRKAREGVTVRFLYDGIGSIMLSRRFLKPMRQAGIKVASFLQGRSLLHRWSVNLRNHRKIVVVDGRTGFTGGMNIGDEYLGKSRHYGYWRDTHLRISYAAADETLHRGIEILRKLARR